MTVVQSGSGFELQAHGKRLQAPNRKIKKTSKTTANRLGMIEAIEMILRND